MQEKQKGLSEQTKRNDNLLKSQTNLEEKIKQLNVQAENTRLFDEDKYQRLENILEMERKDRYEMHKRNERIAQDLREKITRV